MSKKPSEVEIITGLVLPSFALKPDEKILAAPQAPRRRVVKVALDWQQMGFNGSSVEARSAMYYPGKPGTWKPGRVNELTGLMASAGEQLCLAWTAEQDAQRWERRGRVISRAHKRMAIRALAEMSSYFSLGAANTLANIALRVLILDERAIAPFKWASAFSPSSYAPGSGSRKEWLSFPGNIVQNLEQVVPAISSDRSLGFYRPDTAERRCRRLVAVLKALQADKRFLDLVERRGMDYHRHRPQSLDSGSPRSGVWVMGPGYMSIDVGGIYPDPDYDSNDVRKIAARGLEALTAAMSRARPLIISAASSLGYSLDID